MQTSTAWRHNAPLFSSYPTAIGGLSESSFGYFFFVIKAEAMTPTPQILILTKARQLLIQPSPNDLTLARGYLDMVIQHLSNKPSTP